MTGKSDFDRLTARDPSRARHFTAPWFRDLFAARLSLGETFWVGNYGVAMAVVPLSFLVIIVAGGVLPPAAASLVAGLWLWAVTLYYAALVVTVARLAWTTRGIAGWGWAGVALTAIHAVIAIYAALVYLQAGLAG